MCEEERKSYIVKFEGEENSYLDIIKLFVGALEDVTIFEREIMNKGFKFENSDYTLDIKAKRVDT